MKHLFLFENYPHRSGGLMDLEKYLIKFSIPLNEWGKGYAKTIEHLFLEIESEECSLTEENGILIRNIEFVMCEIFYRKGEKIYKLIEDKQIFKDGRIRRRKKDSSVSEKMKIGENPIQSLIRGIDEELGVSLNESQLSREEDLKEEEFSQSFPGLMTRYKGHNFTCFFNDSQYNPKGYIENQKDKSTYFVWEDISL